ncbi:MAG: hypothetical protein V4691_02025 [Pseudomonadota bacterium]
MLSSIENKYPASQSSLKMEPDYGTLFGAALKSLDLPTVDFDKVSTAYNSPMIIRFPHNTKNKHDTLVEEPMNVMTENDMLAKVFPKWGLPHDSEAHVLKSTIKSILDELEFFGHYIASPLRGGSSDPNMMDETKLYLEADEFAKAIVSSTTNVFDQKTGQPVGLSNYAFRKLTRAMPMPGYDPRDDDTPQGNSGTPCCV